MTAHVSPRHEHRPAPIRPITGLVDGVEGSARLPRPLANLRVDGHLTAFDALLKPLLSDKSGVLARGDAPQRSLGPVALFQSGV
jgi:hypothetical protein